MRRQRLQVFVSSTYEDMKAERQVAVECILRAGDIPAGMELFTGDKSQWETIKHWIDASDIFLIILGGRYGSIEPNSGKSYVHLEYEYALAQGKRIIASVIDPATLEARVKSRGSSILELANHDKRENFIQLVRTKIAPHWKSIEDLRDHIVVSLNAFHDEGGFVGWIRGDEIPEPRSVIHPHGLVEFRNTYDAYQWNSIIENSKDLLIVMNDGRSWVNSHREQFRQRITDISKRTRAIFYHPKSAFLPILLRKNHKELAVQIGDIKMSFKSLNNSRIKGSQLEIRGHHLYNPYSLVMTEDVAVITPYMYMDRGALPLLIFSNDAPEPYYRALKEDAENLFNTSAVLTEKSFT